MTDKELIIIDTPEILSKSFWEGREYDLRKNKTLTPVESGNPITSITLDLTTKCNLACHYCFTNLSTGKYAPCDLTLEQGKKTIDWLFKPEVNGGAKQIDLAFWGGEPLVKFDLLKELVFYGEEKTKETGIRISFNGTTNVTLLTQEKIDFFLEHNIQFLLSIDGRKETHNTHRVLKDGTGSFDLIEANLDAILKAWPEGQVRLSYSEENIENFAEDVKFLYERGFNNIAYSPVCEGSWPEEKLEALRTTWDIIAEWWKELRREGKPIYLKYVRDSCQTALRAEGNRPPCGAARGYVAVASDGSIYPCHRFHKFTDQRPWWEKEVCIGHIDYGIVNQEYRELFMNWDTERDMPSSCKSCKSFNINCNGGCWATNWDNENNLGVSPKVFCETQIKNLEIGHELLESDLGDSIKRELGYGRQNNAYNNLPMVQGCQCYNVEDNLFGRKTSNPSDPYSCLCNMATYGTPPNYPVKSCDCYNIEDRIMTHWDNEDFDCRSYQTSNEEHKCCGGENHDSDEDSDCKCKKKEDKNPVELALDYLKDERLMMDKLTIIEKSNILEFQSLLEIKAMGKKC